MSVPVQGGLPKLPEFIVRGVERAIHDAKHPKGMHTNGPAYAQVEVSILERVYRYATVAIEQHVIASQSAAPVAPSDAAGRATQQSALEAARNMAYPVPDSPHASVMQRAVNDRIAFSRGFKAASGSAQPANIDPHWLDSPQSALGGKTAREGYAANPEYAGIATQAATVTGAQAGASEVPCPFCGSIHIHEGAGGLKCANCRARGPWYCSSVKWQDRDSKAGECGLGENERLRRENAAIKAMSPVEGGSK